MSQELSGVSRQSSIEKAKTKLSPLELTAYEEYHGPSLAVQVQAQLFELFLNGNTCEEILKVNKNFSLGMIVKARVEGLWDERRETHVATLLENVRERTLQIQLEAVHFVAGVLSVAHKQHGEKFQRYLQTGDDSILDGIAIKNLKQYQQAVEILLKLTGQSNDQKVTGKVEHIHSVEPAGKELSPEKAAGLLKFLDDEEEVG